jgi:anti-sigma factor RsiW
MSPHEEFLELAAAASSGELTPGERQKLDEHLAICGSCRQAAQEFESTIRTAIPAIAPDLSDKNDTQSGSSFSLEQAEARLFERLDREEGRKGIEEFAPRTRDGERHRAYFPSRIRWGQLGLTSAAMALFALGLAVTAYRTGRNRTASGETRADASGAVEEQLADAGHEARAVPRQNDEPTLKSTACAEACNIVTGVKLSTTRVLARHRLWEVFLLLVIRHNH